MSKLALAILGCTLLVAGPRTAVGACPCDCNDDGQVSVAELVRAVQIALGSRDLGDCPSVTDCLTGDCSVTINHLIGCVSAALRGCPPASSTPAPPSPSPTEAPPFCTPPPCQPGELPVCGGFPLGCPHGCGTICATPRPTFTATATNATPTETSTLPTTPSWSPTGTPVGPGPDLVVESIATSHLSSSSCGPFEALSVCVVNRGDTASGSFTVELVGVESIAVASLEPLERRCLLRPHTRSAGSAFTAIADAGDTVAEADEHNNTLTDSVRWPTIRATCTATRTRTPAPPGLEARQTSTPGDDTTWMRLIPCRQCEPCGLSVNDQLALLDGAAPSVENFVPDGIEILDQHAHSAGVTCAACGCPQSGSPVLGVLVHLDDVAELQKSGWMAHR